MRASKTEEVCDIFQILLSYHPSSPEHVCRVKYLRIDKLEKNRKNIAEKKNRICTLFRLANDFSRSSLISTLRIHRNRTDPMQRPIRGMQKYLIAAIVGWAAVPAIRIPTLGVQISNIRSKRGPNLNILYWFILLIYQNVIRNLL